MLELTIVPAIIPKSLEHLFDMFAKLHGIATEAQIDIVDGVFVPDKSWPYSMEDAGREGVIEASIALFAENVPQNLSYELDLMIQEPLQLLSLWLPKKPKKIVLHIESFDTDEHLTEAIAMIREVDGVVVLASQNDTPLERLLTLIPKVNAVQCMGIAQIGSQGQPFDMRVLERIQTIRQAYPALPISVDGSVNKDTIISLKVAGANRFVVGSGIFNTPDPVRAYTELHDIVLME